MLTSIHSPETMIYQFVVYLIIKKTFNDMCIECKEIFKQCVKSFKYISVFLLIVL